MLHPHILFTQYASVKFDKLHLSHKNPVKQIFPPDPATSDLEVIILDLIPWINPNPFGMETRGYQSVMSCSLCSMAAGSVFFILLFYYFIVVHYMIFIEKSRIPLWCILLLTLPRLYCDPWLKGSIWFHDFCLTPPEQRYWQNRETANIGLVSQLVERRQQFFSANEDCHPAIFQPIIWRVF